MMYDYKCQECGVEIKSKTRADSIVRRKHESHCFTPEFKRVWSFTPDLRNCR